MLKRLFADYYHGKDKDREIEKFIKAIPANENLLDVGAGEMPYKKYCSHIKYTSQDFCKYDGKGDNTGIQTTTFNTDKINIVSDISKIPVVDTSFSNILCTEVLEHVINPNDSLTEMFRILKPGGKLLITVPGTSLLHFSPYHFYTGFKTNYFSRIFNDNNISIDTIKRIGSIYSIMALYIWIILYKIAKLLFPFKPSLIFRLTIILFAPAIILLLIMDRIKIFDPEALEAGILIIGTKLS
jgi:SAM-dependent methyltransferase